MRPQSVTVSSATTSAAIPVDYRQAPFNLGIVGTQTGTATWKVQVTADDIFDPSVTPVWVDDAVITGKAANFAGQITYPVKAIRLNVTAYTDGVVKLTAIQGDVS